MNQMKSWPKIVLMQSQSERFRRGRRKRLLTPKRKGPIQKYPIRVGTGKSFLMMVTVAMAVVEIYRIYN